MDRITFINNPKASSGLGVYIAEALERAGVCISRINPLGSRWHKLVPVLRSFRMNRDAMWKARWENMVFSSWAWDRNTRCVGRQLEHAGDLDKPILIVGKEYYPHPDFRNLNYSIFIHHNMRLALADGVTPWLPAKRDIPEYLERETQLYQHAQNIFVGGQFVADNLVNEYGVAREKISIPGGGAHPYFEAHPAEAVPDRFTGRMLFVGWDFGMKGGKNLLEAFRIVHAERPDLTLMIAGPDESQWVEQPGVKWLGRVSSKDELITLYRESDLFVMPSLRDSFGFVFLEAMIQGVPCIGTDINAMPEIIKHGETGYVVPLRDPKTLAERILEYYSNERNRKAMGEAALAHVKSRYTWEKVANLIVGKMSGRGP